MSRTATRRRWLRVAGAGAVGVLAGCSSGGDSSNDGEAGSGGDGSTDEKPDDDGTSTGGDGTAAADGTTAGPGDGGPAGYSMYQHDAARTGYASGATAPTAAVTPQWRADLGDAYGPTSPVVVDDTIYFGGAERVLALSAADGSETWSTPVGTPVNTAPTVVDDTVYVGGDAAVAALSAADGSERWSRTVDELRSASGAITSPVVADGTVYVNPANGPLLALNAADGSVEWHFSADDRMSAAPAVADDTVYITSWDERLYALNAGDGSVQWTFEAGEAMKTTPAVAGDTVYVGSDDGKAYAVPRGGGSERWAYEVTDGSTEYVDDVAFSPAVAEGAVYVATRTGVHAVGAADGSERWVVDPEGAVTAPPLVADGTVYVPDNEGVVHALGSEDGSVRWRFDTADPLPMVTYTSDATTTPEPQEEETTVQKTPSVADGTLYVPVERNRAPHEIYALVEG